ncbi:alkaline phosphatase family protein [Ferroplasma sp.]|uniref:alkaline phosphatase family protein n=1 Tax=Ferroplasma sp. TaxID=2591003 RepID=UPI0026365D97|nr:alkaline phosphatase family protein [Ferroplasma sp.]
MIDRELEYRYKSDAHFVYPDYNGYNFSNINNTILSLFNISHRGRGLEKRLYGNICGPKKVVFVYIDGLGYDSWINYLGNYKAFDEINRSGTVSPITAIFPSTTAAASNTINTGTTPPEHGLFEWRLYIEQYNMVLKSLPFIPAYKQDRERFSQIKPDPSILFHGKTFYEKLKENGVKSYVVSHADLLKSSYSRIMYSGAREKKRYDFLFEGFLILRKLLAKMKEDSYVFFYIEDPDKMEHRYGPGSLEHLESLHYIAEMFDGLLKALAGQDISIIISSDHGFTPVYNKIYVSGVSNLMASRGGLRIPETWSPRDMAMHTENPSELKYALENQLEGRADVITKSELLASGILGDKMPDEKYKSRIGDVTVLPYSGNTVWYRYYEDDIIKDRRMHGGLSREEMIIPFAAINLRDLKNY